MEFFFLFTIFDAFLVDIVHGVPALSVLYCDRTGPQCRAKSVVLSQPNREFYFHFLAKHMHVSDACHTK